MPSLRSIKEIRKVRAAQRTEALKKQFAPHQDKTGVALTKEIEEYGQIVQIPIKDIIDDKTFQIRTQQIEKYRELLSSIKEIGQQVPAIVKYKDGKFQLISGFHRKQAVADAGLKYLKAIIVSADDNLAMKITEADNYFRGNMTFMDTISHIKRLQSEYSLKTEQVASRLKVDVRTIQLYLQVGENKRIVDLILKDKATFRDGIDWIKRPEVELNRILDMMEGAKGKNEAKEVKRKINKTQEVFINQAKDKIKITIVGTCKNKDKVIEKLKDAIEEVKKA
jgi:ParB/RepB/Spo0J family partition protein